MRCWVVGASGLLGQGVARAAGRARWTVVTAAIPWDDPERAVQTLARELAAFLDDAGDERWSIAWCAGAGVVGTSQEALDAELTVFTAFMDVLASAVTTRDAGRRGALFVASSAGALLAGSSRPPFDETTDPRPLAPYGHQKTRIEAVVAEVTRRCALPAMIGRISNLFGPGQDLAKPQGLVSQLGRAFLTRQPLPIYVSLDTMRDYVFVDDCAAMVVRGLDVLAGAEPRDDGPVVKILASGRSTTIAALLGEFARVFKRPPPVVIAQNPNSRFQVRDLRLRSVVWTELDDLVRTPLGAGIAATARDVSGQLHGRPTLAPQR